MDVSQQITSFNGFVGPFGDCLHSRRKILGRFVLALAASFLMADRQLAGQQPTMASFDGPGDSQYNLDTHEKLPDPNLFPGGPKGTGQFVRLAYAVLPDGAPNVGTINFDVTAPGEFGEIVAQFDFRITPGIGKADGFGFSLLNTAIHDPNGMQGGLAEEANFTGSIGIGFDIFENLDLEDINDNHISVHFKEEVLDQKDVSSFGDLASGKWIHVKIDLKPGSTPTGGKISVKLFSLDEDGFPSDPNFPVFDEFEIEGYEPYESRVHFGARSGGQTANHDLDNIHVEYITVDSLFSFSSEEVIAVEGGVGKAFLGVFRLGVTDTQAMVDYETSDGSAKAGSDYVTTTETLTFEIGEKLKTFTIDILDNDDMSESDENFNITLMNPTSGTSLGDPAVMTVTIRDFDEVDPNRVGRWTDPNELGIVGDENLEPIVSVHMCLLPNSKVIFWEDRTTGDDGEIGQIRLWDPPAPNSAGNGVFSKPGELPGYDLFCVGHSFLSDGKLFLTGGQKVIDGEGVDGIGLERVSTYDPFEDTWNLTEPNMTGSRWYPTNTTLASGEVLVVSGSLDESFTPNKLPQIWQPTTHTWQNLDDAMLSLPLYPFMFQAPNGQVFYAGPGQTSRYLDLSFPGDWTTVADSSASFRDYGSAVIFNGKVLILGGTPDPARPDHVFPIATAEVIDLNSANPAWSTVSPMSFARRHQNATLLPDGKVLVTGGTSSPGFNNVTGAVFTPEMWDPETDTWTILVPNKVPRMYHSCSLLLPDGRVLSAGGGQPGSPEESDIDHTNVEIYSPPYLFKGPRPVIVLAPAGFNYGEIFLIGAPEAEGITKVTLIRLGAVTHAFDQNQRFIELDNFSTIPGGLKIKSPSNPNLAPPGHYMLFLINSAGVPSIGKIVQLGLVGPVCQSQPISDLNADCIVDFFDFAIFVSSWLTCGLEPEEACGL